MSWSHVACPLAECVVCHKTSRFGVMSRSSSRCRCSAHYQYPWLLGWDRPENPLSFRGREIDSRHREGEPLEGHICFQQVQTCHNRQGAYFPTATPRRSPPPSALQGTVGFSSSLVPSITALLRKPTNTHCASCVPHRLLRRL